MSMQMKQIRRTILLTLAAIGGCLILGIAMAPFYGDRMPQSVVVENRSRNVIEVDICTTSDRKTSKDRFIVLSGESATMHLGYDETNIACRTSITRHLGRGKTKHFDFSHAGIIGRKRLVFTDANKLEEHSWYDALPKVVSDSQTPFKF